MTSIKLKTVIIAGLTTLVAGGTAHAQIVGGSSNTSVTVGESQVNGGPHVSGRPGIGVPGTGGRRIDFQGLETYSRAGADGVRKLDMPDGRAPGDHAGYGSFRFAKVSNANVYFGEWSKTDANGQTSRAVYYVGDSAGTTVPTSGTATYAVKGIGTYDTKGALTGTFTATFGSGTSGRLTGSLANASTGAGLNIGTAVITGAAFNGQNARATQGGANVATGGVVEGRFYGANAAALAGIATFANASHNTAFGGTKN